MTNNKPIVHYSLANYASTYSSFFWQFLRGFVFFEKRLLQAQEWLSTLKKRSFSGTLR